MKMRLLTTTVILMALIIGALAQPPAPAAADPTPNKTYRVDSNGNDPDFDLSDPECDDGSGHCTLRAAIQEANSTPELDRIEFVIEYSDPPPSLPCQLTAICPTYTLPTISAPVIIDGTTQPGWAPGAPVVELDGNNEPGVGPGVDALIIDAGNSIVRGLWIHSFTRYAVDIRTVGGNIIEGNWIGDVLDTTDSRCRNYSDGIYIENVGNNVIGGTTVAQRNVISGNGYKTGGGCTYSGTTYAYGVTISGVNAAANIVQGNYIGTDPLGLEDKGNTRAGVYVNGAPNNTVGGVDGTTPGGACTGACNLMSGNDGGGVVITGAGATGNDVLGNLIGTTADGLGARGNSGNGVHIDDSSSNTIGGLTASARNVISKNGTGIRIEGSTSTGNIVQGNYVGLPTTGMFETAAADLGNGDGVNVFNAPNNTIGGTAGITDGGPCTGACNTISDNGGNGIEISGGSATGNVVEGNYIGFDATGEADPGECYTMSGHETGNVSDGIYVTGASGNRIGGITEAARNFIGCNGPDDESDDAGIEIYGSTAQSNVIQGNHIGWTVSGASAGNAADGVRITSGHHNTVGGSTPAEGNAIGNNGWTGVQIRESNAHDNVVQANYISNSGEGVYVNVAHDNIIGGTAAAEANVIVLSTRGVTIYGATGTGNIVQGNYIGTDEAGTPGLGNSADGVFLSSAPANTIGGAESGAGNVISGNGAVGVEVYDLGASGNVIQGNYIGIDPTGASSLGNAADGIFINNAPSTVIGGTSQYAGNVIGANYDGIYISGLHATNNTIQGNLVGTDETGTINLGNAFDGVRVGANSTNTAIGGIAAGAGNTIGFNGGNGVLVDRSVGNAILSNSIFGNVGDPGSTPKNWGLGIDLVSALDGWGPNENDAQDPDPLPPNTGGNNYQNFPVPSSAVAEDGSTTILGAFNSTPNTNNFRLEFFSNDSCDPSGYGEGQTLLTTATVNTNASGDAPAINIVLPYELPDGAFITATATDPANNTSEFSPCWEVTGPPDTDVDGIPDDEDNCPLIANPGQFNSDGGRRPNGAQAPGEWASNPAGDNLGDACDDDNDNDGLADVDENEASCPFRLDGDSDDDRALDASEISAGKDECNAGSRPTCTGTTDTDGDGFIDCIEHVGYNTCASTGDPTPGYSACANSTDSDADGCPDWIEIVDVNGNRQADVPDVMLIAKRALLLLPESDSDVVFDINKDGLLLLGDALMAARNSILLKPYTLCSAE